MKKLILSLIVVTSFLMGNLSMIATIIRIFGKDALIPVVKDLVGQKVNTLLWGEPLGPRPSLGRISYDRAVARERDIQRVAEGGPILKPAPSSRRAEGYGYGPLR